MIHEKRMGIVMDESGHYSRAVIVMSKDFQYEWARPTDKDNLVLFPGAYREEELYELPVQTENVDNLVIALNEEYA